MARTDTGRIYDQANVAEAKASEDWAEYILDYVGTAALLLVLLTALSPVFAVLYGIPILAALPVIGMLAAATTILVIANIFAGVNYNNKRTRRVDLDADHFVADMVF